MVCSCHEPGDGGRGGVRVHGYSDVGFMYVYMEVMCRAGELDQEPPIVDRQHLVPPLEIGSEIVVEGGVTRGGGAPQCTQHSSNKKSSCHAAFSCMEQLS